MAIGLLPIRLRGLKMLNPSIKWKAPLWVIVEAFVNELPGRVVYI
jgi:hypothetical protein